MIHNHKQFERKPYSERAYFDGDHCLHCVAREEHLRLKRIKDDQLRVLHRR